MIVPFRRAVERYPQISLAATVPLIMETSPFLASELKFYGNCGTIKTTDEL
jgi:hypothetical protein